MATHLQTVNAAMQDLITVVVEAVQTLEGIDFLPDGCFDDEGILDEESLREYLNDLLDLTEGEMAEKWPDNSHGVGYDALADIADDVDIADRQLAREAAAAVEKKV